jgi:hypothetical protein
MTQLLTAHFVAEATLWRRDRGTERVLAMASIVDLPDPDVFTGWRR